jgi:hypothetical protein
MRHAIVSARYFRRPVSAVAVASNRAGAAPWELTVPRVACGEGRVFQTDGWGVVRTQS